jgi:hypothetical protein
VQLPALLCYVTEVPSSVVCPLAASFLYRASTSSRETRAVHSGVLKLLVRDYASGTSPLRRFLLGEMLSFCPMAGQSTVCHGLVGQIIIPSGK